MRNFQDNFEARKQSFILVFSICMTDDTNYDKLSEITIPNTQSLFRELNDGQIPDELNLFSGGNGSANALKFHAIKKVSLLHENNKNFLDYLSSDLGREVLSKNKMKTHLDSGNMYYNDLNMRVYL